MNSFGPKSMINKCSHCQLRNSQTRIKIYNKMREVCNECYKLLLNVGRAPVNIEIVYDNKEEKRGEK